MGEIVVKARGSEPCLVVTAAQRIEIAALRLSAEQVIDTTAAGDLQRRLSRSTLQGRRHRRRLAGHRLAAAVIQHPGPYSPPHAITSETHPSDLIAPAPKPSR